MKTVVRIENTNCTYCVDDARKVLLESPLVHSVEMNAATGCLDVEHDFEGVSALTGLLRDAALNWEVADNGEIVMIASTCESSGRCARHPKGNPALSVPSAGPVEVTHE